MALGARLGSAVGAAAGSEGGPAPRGPTPYPWRRPKPPTTGRSALLFQLVAGEPLVSSNRDDDCVDGNAMAALGSWNDDAGKRGIGDAWRAPPTILGILPGAALACGSPPPRD